MSYKDKNKAKEYQKYREAKNKFSPEVYQILCANCNCGRKPRGEYTNAEESD